MLRKESVHVVRCLLSLPPSLLSGLLAPEIAPLTFRVDQLPSTFSENAFIDIPRIVFHYLLVVSKSHQSNHENWESISMVDHLPNIHEALGSILGTIEERVVLRMCNVC